MRAAATVCYFLRLAGRPCSDDRSARLQIVEKQLKTATSGHDTAVAERQKELARAARLKEVRGWCISLYMYLFMYCVYGHLPL
eukprot:SAG22_NODE_131_length_18561_cov_10.941387_5_plen_83_part_00